MKKILSVMAMLFVFGAATIFADPATDGKKHLLTCEATAGVIAVGVNEVATYDFMFTENFGIGGGIAVSEGIIGDVDAFLDVKVWKWNFGVGGGYDWGFNTGSILFRAVYHGNSWQWGPGKAGMTLGADWHLAYMGDSKNMTPGEGFTQIIHVIPRFVIGINWQLGF